MSAATSAAAAAAAGGGVSGGAEECGQSAEVRSLREQLERTQADLRQLRGLARCGLTEHDDLKIKYDEVQKQLKATEQKYVESEAKLLGLQKVLEPACDEFNALQEKLDIEKTCRLEAEVHASKFFKENAKLKRQSAMLLDQIGGARGDVPPSILETLAEEDRTDGIETDREALTLKIFSLEVDVKTLEQKLMEVDQYRMDTDQRTEAVNVKCLHLERELDEMRQTLRSREEALENLNKLTQLACADYEALQEKFEIEQGLKRDAIRYAQAMSAERDVMVRESAIMLGSAVADERLSRALLEVELVMKKHQKEIAGYEDRVRELTESLERSGDARALGLVEERLSLAEREVERLQRVNADVEKLRDKLEKENRALIDAVDVYQQKHVPPPPPPPPPPPTFLRPLQLLNNKFKSGKLGDKPDLTRAGKPKDKRYEDALAEMMQRIKQGGGLKPVEQKTVVDARSNAMNELQRTLQAMKKVSPSRDSVAVQSQPSKQQDTICTDKTV